MKHSVKIILKVLISAVLLWVLFNKVNFKEVVTALASLHTVTFILCVCVALGLHMVNSVKWKLFLPNNKLKDLYVFTLIGQWYGLVLPGQIAGEAAKALRFAANNDEHALRIASVFVDKFTSVLGLAIVSFIGLIFTSSSIPAVAWYLVVVAILSGVLCVGLFQNTSLTVFAKRILAVPGIFFPNRIRQQVSLIFDESVQYLKDINLLLKSIVYGALFQAGAILIVYLIGQNLALVVSYWDYAWVFGIVSIALFIPVTIAGLGVRESLFALLLLSLGVQNVQAVALSIGVFSVQLLVALIGGVLEFRKLFFEAPLPQ